MSKNQNRIPIDIKHPEEFLGHEFYLAIAREHLFDDIYGRSKASIGLVQKMRLTAKRMAYRVLGIRSKDFRDYDGTIIEITGRHPASVEGFLWPDFNRAVLEDGTRVNQLIPHNEVFRNYLFVPTVAHESETSAYEMNGTLRPLDVPHNQIEDLEQKVSIQYDKVPQGKSKGSKIVYLAR